MIRPAEKKDFGKIVKLLKTVEKDFVPPLSDRGSIEGRVKRELEEGLYLVSEEKGFLNGLICVFENWKKKSGYISIIAVHPVYRRRGVAKKLMEEGLKVLADKKVKEIYVTTWSTNKPGLKFYRSYGFIKDSVALNERREGVHTVYLKKSLYH